MSEDNKLRVVMVEPGNLLTKRRSKTLSKQSRKRWAGISKFCR